MNPQPRIADLPLRDIHLPEPIGWWPPAPGWWLLLLILLTGIVFIVRWAIKRKQRLSTFRSAIKELTQIRADYRQNNDAKTLAQALSILLRRVAMSVTSRDTAAGLTGERWLDYLDGLVDGHTGEPCLNTPAGRLLLEAPYQPSSDIDGNALLDLCAQWINRAARPRKRAGLFVKKKMHKKTASGRKQHA